MFQFLWGSFGVELTQDLECTRVTYGQDLNFLRKGVIPVHLTRFWESSGRRPLTPLCKLGGECSTYYCHILYVSYSELSIQCH